MIIALYGAGYVGLVSAACLAKLGHYVICADINKERIALLLKGECPIYEKDLPALLREQQASGRLLFTTDLSLAIKEATVHMIATGTPSLPNGNADLSQVFAVALQIAKEAEGDCLLVTKSTVPVGTGDAIQSRINSELAQRAKTFSINVASNPEFLREGTAVYDFLNADRIILGGDEKALDILETIYNPLIEQKIPVLKMSLRSAELTKYSANAMLACKISFMNQISRLADDLDANIDEIRAGIASDHRIGPDFLEAGIGYGGSCFPKDVRALIQIAKSLKVNTNLLDAIEEINFLQKNWVIEQVNKHFNSNLSGLTIGIWGLAFKPGTDDMREASSLVAIESLLKAGGNLRVFDPVAMPAARKFLTDNLEITYCDSAEEVLATTLDGLVIATEWPQFKAYNLDQLKIQLKEAPIFDGRNCYDLAKIKAAKLAYYYSVGRPAIIRNSCL